MCDVKNQARSDARLCDKSGEHIRLVTLSWRAPELLYGDTKFGAAADMWSCGLVFAEMADVNFHMGHQNRLAYLKALMKQLGTPEATSLVALPAYHGGFKAAVRQQWPSKVFDCVGSSGLELLDGFLQWEPSSRISAAEALEHGYLQDFKFRMVGSASNVGKRHRWNMLAAQMPHDALMWLRADPALTSSGLKALELNFGMQDKRTKSEENRKVIMAGFSYAQPPTKQMCCLSLERPLPLPRFEAWAAAFRVVNTDSFATLEARARQAVGKLDHEELGENGRHFMGVGMPDWLGTCGEFVVSAPINSDGTGWVEPAHQDGGASIVHLGVTLFGRRELVCQQDVATSPDSGLPPVVLLCPPGSVYMGGLTGPVHQVTHHVPRPGEVLRGSGVATSPEFAEGLSVTIMCRTALFPHNQARLRNVTPSPQAFFTTLAESVRASFAELPFRLPTLPEILRAVEPLPSGGSVPGVICAAKAKAQAIKRNRA